MPRAAAHHHHHRACRPRRPLRTGALAVLTCLLAGLTVLAAGASAQRLRPRLAGGRQQCADPYSSIRNPANPLDLAQAPGSDPLNGAQFFVPGPAHGSAASQIATLLGINPETLPADESWADFDRRLQTGPLAARLAADPTLAHDVDALALIAAEPEAQRISSVSEGGGPGAIFKQTEKILCQNMQADPGTVPIFNTYFLHPVLGGCPTPAQVTAYDPVFHRRVDEMAAAIDRRPAVLLLEIDAIGSSSCIARSRAMRGWEADLRYEINAMRALPHTVVYIEGGYSDSNSVGYTARILNAIGVDHIRGFFTNDTHNNWTSKEVGWATAISRRTGGAHFIVNTSNNGRGPLLNAHPTAEGVENLCNPPGRGLGPRDATDTGVPSADAFLWTHPPGNSSGHCGGAGAPSSGAFWWQYAVGLADRANGQLGPGFPSLPY
ncbi:MAG: glycoside hydrolase family 6 protein [Solirubrobacterales bacterium]|nr:glycoside hydrolase family 6 protein [Solirubrobacterales bacterium]